MSFCGAEVVALLGGQPASEVVANFLLSAEIDLISRAAFRAGSSAGDLSFLSSPLQ